MAPGTVHQDTRPAGGSDAGPRGRWSLPTTLAPSSGAAHKPQHIRAWQQRAHISTSKQDAQTRSQNRSTHHKENTPQREHAVKFRQLSSMLDRGRDAHGAKPQRKTPAGGTSRALALFPRWRALDAATAAAIQWQPQQHDNPREELLRRNRRAGVRQNH